MLPPHLFFSLCTCWFHSLSSSIFTASQWYYYAHGTDVEASSRYHPWTPWWLKTCGSHSVSYFKCKCFMSTVITHAGLSAGSGPPVWWTSESLGADQISRRAKYNANLAFQRGREARRANSVKQHETTHQHVLRLLGKNWSSPICVDPREHRE